MDYGATNSEQVLKLNTNMTCTTCQAPLTGKQKRYCSTICKNANSNSKHNDYPAQQKRARRRKIQFIIEMGGKCSICGYRKNLAALTFHHTDPSLKEMKLDRRMMSNYKLERLISEVAKCTLLCSNCHAEHHHPDEELWWTRRELNPEPRP